MRQKSFHDQLNDLTFSLQDVADMLDDSLPEEIVEPNGADIPDHLDAYIGQLNSAIDELQDRIRTARDQLQ